VPGAGQGGPRGAMMGGPGRGMAPPGGGMGVSGPGMGGRGGAGMGGPGGLTGGPPGGPGGLAGGPGRGGPAGPGQNDNGPADFHTPEGAVKAFLSALKAKDLDRLNEASALRAPVEADSSKNQELFKKIFDLSLSDSELDQLAEALDGYTIAGENPPKSTGRVDVILRKAGKNSGYFSRKITVRHEKKGWGVLDISGQTEFKPMQMIPRRGATGRRR
jgi:hypothetical protein